MKKGGMRGVVLGAAILAAAGALAAADHYKLVTGPANFYYGHVSYIEPGPEGAAPAVLREGRTEPEEALLNMPLGPGDTVRTSADRRVELQFDTGTVVRLDFSTELRIETILARSLSKLDEVSVMALEKGRIYVMYKEYDRKELFQVLTANAAVRLKHNSVATISAAGDGATEAQVKYGRAQVRFGRDERSLADRAVGKGERLIVLADHQFELAPAIGETAFELWNKDINARFDDLHEGLSALPKPLQKLPPAVFYFAQAYGSRYGEWLWDDLYGYIWRPFVDNGAYPWGWQPYFAGQWASYNGQMFWIPGEPWGWVPYHLGVWQWSKKLGWVWLPGSMFAPAWATWDFYFFYAGWRPWNLYDWMYGHSPYGWSGFYYDGGVWNYGPYGGAAGSGLPPTVIRKDQLKDPKTPYPLPAELRKVLANVIAADKRGDPRVAEDSADPARQLVFVDKRRLAERGLENKAVTWDRVPKVGPPADGTNGQARHRVDPQREAARLFRGVDGASAPPRRISPPPAPGTEHGLAGALPARTAVREEAQARRGQLPVQRFRDWNPDLRVARELGASIVYSSANNEIRCPELGLSSRDRERGGEVAPRLTPRGISYGPATGLGGQGSDRYGGPSGLSGGSSSSGAPSSGSGGAAERSSTSSRGAESRGSGESKGGSETVRIKN